MRLFHNLTIGMRGLFRKGEVNREMDEELRHFTDSAAEDKFKSGMDSEEALRSARIEVGSFDAVKERTLSIGWENFFDSLWQDVCYAARMLRRNPGLTLTVLLTLALGIGATTAIFTVDYATLLAPLPYPHSEQLVMLWSKVQGYRGRVSPGDFIDWKRQSTAFQDIHAWTSGSFNLAAHDNAQPDFIQGRINTPGIYQMQGYGFSLGRDFLPEEGLAGQNHVVILANKLWKRLGSDPRIIGTTMRVNGEPYTVVGVLAPGLTDRGQGELAVPLVLDPDQTNHDMHRLTVMGRLKPGVTLKQAQANLSAVAAHLAETYPQSNKGWGVSVEPLKNDFLPSERFVTLWLLLGAVGFVLLIACVNVANLLLARGITRQKEMAVRSALGAKRRVIFAQMLTESLLLALMGGLLGLGVGSATLRGLVAIMPPNTLPSEAVLQLNFPILLFALGTTTLAGLLFGCLPAWYASRIDPSEALKEGGRLGTGAGRQKLRRALVTAEFALALALLAGAGLTIHSFWNLLRVDLGIRTDHIFTFLLHVPESRPKDPETIRTYYKQMLASIESVPGVSAVTAMTGMPLEGGGFGLPFTFAGEQVNPDPLLRTRARFEMVTPGYFRTFGVRIVGGRGFSGQDTASSVKVAMVNEDFVHKYLEGRDPLNQRLEVPQLVPGTAQPGPPVEWQIVGVYHNVRSPGVRENIPEIEVPFEQMPWQDAGIGVRTAEDPASMTRSITAAVHTVDPEIALATPRTMEQVRDDVLANNRFMVVLFASFAAVALLLSALGIYGVMTFSVLQRSHEIALRMALGATRNRLVILVVKEGAMLACIGLGFGFIGALFVGHAIQSLLFGVGAIDFSAFAVVGLVLLAAALLACYLPARRAASIEPMEILRME